MSRRRQAKTVSDEVAGHTTVAFVCTGRGRRLDGTRRKHVAVEFGKVHVPQSNEVEPWYEFEREMYLVENEDTAEWDARLRAAASRSPGSEPPAPLALPHETLTLKCKRCPNTFPIRRKNLDDLVRAVAGEGKKVFDLGRV